MSHQSITIRKDIELPKFPQNRRLGSIFCYKDFIYSCSSYTFYLTSLLSLGSEILHTCLVESDCVELLNIMKISYVCLNTLILNNSHDFMFILLNFLLTCYIWKFRFQNKFR